MFSSMLLCILLTSVGIMGALENPNREIAETPQRPMPILTFYTKEQINGETLYTPSSSSNQTNPSSSLDKNKKVKIFYLSGNEVEFTESSSHYNIENDNAIFSLPKESIDSFTICYRRGTSTSSETSSIYKARLSRNPDGTLTFTLDYTKLHGFEESSFIEYLELLRDFIDYSSSDDPTKTKNHIRAFYVHSLESSLRNNDDSLNRFVEILRKRIDEFPSVLPHISKRIAEAMMRSNDGAMVLLENLDKFYLSEDDKRDMIYIRLKEAANMLKEGVPLRAIPRINFVRRPSNR